MALGPLSLDRYRPARFRVWSWDDVSSTSTSFGQWIYGETGGQPFFIVETINLLLDRGWPIQAIETPVTGAHVPPSVREVIRARVLALAGCPDLLAPAPL